MQSASEKCLQEPTLKSAPFEHNQDYLLTVELYYEIKE